MHKVKNSLLIDNILDNGFGTLSGVLSSEKSELLSKKCKEILLSNYEFSGISEDSPKSGIAAQGKIYDNSKTNHRPAYNTKGRPFIGISKTVDDLVEDILTHDHVKNTLVSFLGGNYKIFTCSIRQASHLSDFVGLHQDAPYQFSIAVFLNDIDRTNPTTVFYTNTHNIRFNFADKFEAFNTSYFKNLIPATGKKGDIVFFLNKTLHGMQASLNAVDDSSVLLMCFHPSGYPYTPWRLPNKSMYSSSFISGLGPELRRLFEYRADDYETHHGQLVIKNIKNHSTRLIDQFALNKKISSDFLSIVYWNVMHLSFFIFRVFRKIYRLVLKRS